MPQTGDRWSGNRSPRDLTAKRQQQLLAEKAERERAKDPRVIDERIATARAQGFNQGHADGMASMATAIYSLYKSEGLGAIEEFLRELDEPEDVA